MAPATSQAPSLAAAQWNYWAESYRPLNSLAFVAPLLIGYETGVLWLGPQAVRNGADLWLRAALDALGFGQHFLLPALTVAILLGWHYATREPWRLSGRALYGMLVECAVLAFGLRWLLQVEGMLLESLAGPLDLSGRAALELSPGIRGTVGYLGAGVYEEMLFRMILLPPVVWALGRLTASRMASTAGAVLLTSLVFAIAHYIGPHGETWRFGEPVFWYGFSFRFLAGAFFALLFLRRGFGVAAGTHAGYDILVGIV
jgi:membrane protease YdiL (CAAX protease family)